MVQETEHGTRERVLRAISQHGPVTAASLADQLGLTQAGIRRHLEALVDDGLIEEREHTAGARKRGRPARAFVLTDAGHQRLTGEYDELAVSVLRYLRDHVGDAAVETFARERAAQVVHRFEPILGDEDDPQLRAVALAGALADEGYAASARPMAQGTPMAGVQLCQGHCPVQHVATEFPQFCEAERDAFSQLLGVHVQRLASLAHGDHVCTTFVPLSAVTVGSPATERDPR